MKINNLPKFISDISTEDHLWAWQSVYRLLTPWIPDRYSFAFNNPSSFGDGVNPDVFGAILKHLRDTNGFPEDELMTLIVAFSKACTKAEWEQLYQPILQHTPINISIGKFNSICNPSDRIIPIRIPPPITGDIQGKGLLYPYDPLADTVYILISKFGTEVVDSDFIHIELDEIATIFLPLVTDPDIPNLLIFQGFNTGETITITDVCGQRYSDTWPSLLRRAILEDIWQKFDIYHDVVDLGEGLAGDVGTNLNDTLAHFVALGYDAKTTKILFKPATHTINTPAILVDVTT